MVLEKVRTDTMELCINEPVGEPTNNLWKLFRILVYEMELQTEETKRENEEMK